MVLRLFEKFTVVGRRTTLHEVLPPDAARRPGSILEDIWDYLAADNRQAADRVLDKIEAAICKLAQTPGLGHIREDLADRRHRFFLVYSYLIVYRPDTKPLEIIRIMHASRDVQNLLGLHEEQP